MRQLQTTGIILGRTDYGEADRIITVLTPDQGKLRLMAKGVRRVKSKLAGGIELFSVSDLTFIRGRGDIGTLVSSRLRGHYASIVKDIDRVQLGYQLIKQLNKATEDEPEPAYFRLLEQGFAALDDPSIDRELIRGWFELQLLRLAGHSPNLASDSTGASLDPDGHYDFDFETMAFAGSPRGNFTAAHIKTLRLLLSDNPPAALQKVKGIDVAINDLSPLIRAVFANHIRT